MTGELRAVRLEFFVCFCREQEQQDNPKAVLCALEVYESNLKKRDQKFLGDSGVCGDSSLSRSSTISDSAEAESPGYISKNDQPKDLPVLDNTPQVNKVITIALL